MDPPGWRRRKEREIKKQRNKETKKQREKLSNR